MVWKRARRPFAGGAGSRRRAPGFECHGSRPAFRGPRNMETDGIMRKEDGPIRHKEIFKESDGSVRKGKGWQAGSDLIGIRSATPFWFPWCAGRGSRGVPPPGVEPGAVTKEKTKTVPVGALGASGKGKDPGAPVGLYGGSWGTVRRTGPGSGSSDHSSEPSVSAGAFASRRRDAISRAAPPLSTTTAASAISAMPAPVWARLLR